jgi:hypothetical protein
VTGPLARLQHVDVVRVQAEVGHPVVEDEAETVDDHPAAEGGVDAVGHRDHVAEPVGDRE